MTRRFEVTKDATWIHYSIDDLLYGLIQHYATFNPNEENENHRLYLTEQNYAKHIKEIKDFCSVTAQTLKNHLNKLIKDGVLEKFILVIDGIEYPSYGIIINKNIPYKIIDNDWLFYLVSTRSHNAIKIYLFFWTSLNIKITMSLVRRKLRQSQGIVNIAKLV